MKGEAAYTFLERNPLTRSLVYWRELHLYYPCSVYDYSIKITHFEFCNNGNILQYSFNNDTNKWILEHQYTKKQFCLIFKDTEFDKRHYLISNYM